LECQPAGLNWHNLTEITGTIKPESVAQIEPCYPLQEIKDWIEIINIVVEKAFFILKNKNQQKEKHMCLKEK